MFAEVAKRHTRWFQVPVTARLCGFKSHPLHQKLVAGRDFVLRTTMLCLATHVTWLAPVVACSSAESSSHLTASPTASTKRPVWVFFCGVGVVVLCTSKLRLQLTSLQKITNQCLFVEMKIVMLLIRQLMVVFCVKYLFFSYYVLDKTFQKGDFL